MWTGPDIQPSVGDGRGVRWEGHHGDGSTQHNWDTADSDGGAARDHGSVAANRPRSCGSYLHQQCHGWVLDSKTLI